MSGTAKAREAAAQLPKGNMRPKASSHKWMDATVLTQGQGTFPEAKVQVAQLGLKGLGEYRQDKI
jgi:hypothetical protein